MIYNRSQIIKKCDKLWSELIRGRDKVCQRCGKESPLDAAHIISRTYMATRHDLQNGIALCKGCHIFWWHKEPIEAARWFEQEYPGLYQKLNFKRQAISKIDVQGMYLYLRQEKGKPIYN